VKTDTFDSAIEDHEKRFLGWKDLLPVVCKGEPLRRFRGDFAFTSNIAI
jgi:hypothetical protein